MSSGFTLDVVDYVIAVLVLLVPVVIGIVFAVRDADRVTRDVYLLGGRSMSMLPTAMSIFITFQSAISLIGTPGELYTYGPKYLYIYVGLSISYIVGLFTLIPLMFPLRLTSIYEYLQLRYESNTVRLVSTCIGMLATVCYMAIAMLSPALALQASVGLPLWMSIVIMGVIGTFYTAIGGIKSVIWTDAFQTVMVYVGIFAIIIKGCITVGGPGEVWRLSVEGGRAELFVPEVDPRIRHTYMGTLIGGIFMWLVNAFNQSTTQRICSMKTKRDANMAYLLNIPFTLVYGFILHVVGWVVFAYFYHLKCDPYEAGFISNRNQLAPYFVMHALDDLPGMAGLYTATLSCGALSTLSSGINALAANTVEDILRRPLKSLSEGLITLITKIFVFLYGFAIVGLAYGAQYLSGPVTQMGGTVFGACGSPVLGIFLMGGLVPWANKYGALAGALLSLAFNLWLGIGNRLYGRKPTLLPPITTEKCFDGSFNTLVNPDINSALLQNSSLFLNVSQSTEIPSTYSSPPFTTEVPSGGDGFGFYLYDISYEWYGVTGTVVCLVVGLTVSYLTRAFSLVDKNSQVDPRLVFPFCRRLWSMPDVPYDAPLANTDFVINEKAKKEDENTEMTKI